MAENPASPASVFLTGASSGLGREVARQLIAAGHPVTGAVDGVASAMLFRQVGGLPAYPDPLRAGEVRSAIQAAQATQVVNLGPQIANHVPQIDPQWDTYLRLIDDGTRAIVRAAEEAGVQFLVMVSYAFVYGDTHGSVADETTTPDNHDDNPVIRAALEAEQAVLNSPVPACVLRAGYVYGPHSPETVSLRDRLVAGNPVTPGDPHVFANWVHQQDLARAILLALQVQPAGAVLNIVDNRPASPADFVGYLAESMHLPPPSGGQSFLSRILPARETTTVSNISVRAGNARAKEVLGWTPQFPSYREGLDNTLLVLRAEEPVA